MASYEELMEKVCDYIDTPDDEAMYEVVDAGIVLASVFVGAMWTFITVSCVKSVADYLTIKKALRLFEKNNPDVTKYSKLKKKRFRIGDITGDPKADRALTGLKKLGADMGLKSHGTVFYDTNGKPLFATVSRIAWSGFAISNYVSVTRSIRVAVSFLKNSFDEDTGMYYTTCAYMKDDKMTSPNSSLSWAKSYIKKLESDS